MATKYTEIFKQLLPWASGGGARGSKCSPWILQTLIIILAFLSQYWHFVRILLLSFSSSGPFAHTGAFNPLVSHRAKFQQLNKIAPPTKRLRTPMDFDEFIWIWWIYLMNLFFPGYLRLCRISQKGSLFWKLFTGDCWKSVYLLGLISTWKPMNRVVFVGVGWEEGDFSRHWSRVPKLHSTIFFPISPRHSKTLSPTGFTYKYHPASEWYDFELYVHLHHVPWF